MSVSYDTFTGAFLSKVREYNFAEMSVSLKTDIADGYMKRAISAFKNICIYDLTKQNDEVRELDINIEDEDLDEIVEIISEGMVVQWLKPYVYSQENLENVLKTRDFSAYSPSELLLRIGDAYKKAQFDYKQMIREYSYNHGDLSNLHL